jgi:outer membrane protein OmpA-like peptidoglycan-associated protein
MDMRHGISIIGYADEPGCTAINNTIATERATAVRTYLVSSGIESGSIALCKGMGNKMKTGTDPKERRVDIVRGIRDGLMIVKTEAKAEAKAEPAVKRKRSLRDLSTMKAGEMMVIENLQFKVSTDSFEKESFPILKELADVLEDFPGISIRLEGHICCGGKTDSSKRLDLGYQLSLSRAQAVLEYLTRHGISGRRLSCVGYGFSRPKVFPERNQEDSYLNRRVEIRVTANK